MKSEDAIIDLCSRQIREASRKVFEIWLLNKMDLDLMIEEARRVKKLWDSFILTLENKRKSG